MRAMAILHSEIVKELDQEIFQKVCEQLASVASAGGYREALREDTELISGLGLDSLKFVDLTVALESAFQLQEFPMQEWIDEQLASGRPLTVGELVRACQRLVPRAG